MDEWNFSPAIIAEAQEIGIGARVACHWSEAECQDQEGTVVGVEIHRRGKVEYTVHIDGDISPTDGFTHDIAGIEGGTIRLLSTSPSLPVVDGGEWQGRLLDLVGEYFDLGYAEGVAQRDVDTMAGDAQRVLSGIQGAIAEAVSLISSQKQKIERLTKERDKAISRSDFTQQWYAERLRKIEDVAKRVNVWDEVAAIIANASATRQLPDGSFVYDPPSYAQQLNSAKGRASAAESRVLSLEEEVKRLREALKPFARIADMEEKAAPAASVMVNVSRCRDARNALKENGNG